MVCPPPPTTGATVLPHTEVLPQDLKVPCVMFASIEQCANFASVDHFTKIQSQNLNCFLRELKRLSTVTLSPVYAHFSESLSGLTTIRALRASGRFAEENTTRLDLNQRANYSSECVSVWAWCMCVLSLRARDFYSKSLHGIQVI